MEFKWVNLLPSTWMETLFETLFHSLWIGVVMASLAALVMVGTKNSAPTLRYNLLVGLLGLFVLSMAAVLVLSVNHVNIAAYLFSFDQAQHKVLFNFQLDIFLALSQFLEALKNYTNPMMLIWIAVILFKSAQLLLGLHAVGRLKKSQTFAAGHFWEQKVDQLAQQLQINQGISILQSGLAKIPMVIGHLKPVVLMPIGLLNHLSLAEVEAILGHELAHIKRKDYLVNILQNALEVLFFFNPAVLWLSKMIKEERENCCDDLAIACTNDKNGYLKALVSCQEFSLNATGFAMSMANGKSQLISRIRRIAFNQRTALTALEKTTLIIALFCFLGVIAAFKISRSHIQKSSPSKKEITYRAGLGHTSQNAKQNDQKTMKSIEPVKKSSFLFKETITGDVLELAEANDLEPIEDPVLPQAKPETPVSPVKPVKSAVVVVMQPTSNFICEPEGVSTTTTITTTTSTVKIDGKVVVRVVHDGKDASQEIQKEMLQDNLILGGEKLHDILTENEMQINGVIQDANVHHKYKEKYIKRPDTQYRIGS